MSMLEVQDLVTAYGQIVALKGVSLKVEAGQVVCLLGANGAGKTTLISSVSGILRPRSGRVVLEGRDVAGVKASRIAGLGVTQVPEGRGIFVHMTVHENLQMGAHLRRDHAAVREVFKTVTDMKKEGMTVLLVEQNARLALDIADTVYVLDHGVVVHHGPAAELAANEELIQSLAGASAEKWDLEKH